MVDRERVRVTAVAAGERQDRGAPVGGETAECDRHAGLRDRQRREQRPLGDRGACWLRSSAAGGWSWRLIAAVDAALDAAVGGAAGGVDLVAGGRPGRRGCAGRSQRA